MLKDFNKTKNQLKELASVLNTFKSETVQLKIVELLFQGNPVEEEAIEKIEQPFMGIRKRGRPKKEVAAKPSKVIVKRTRRKVGPTQVIRKLMEENFFKTKRPIGDIVIFSNEKMNLPLKSNDFSGILMNYIREKKLVRDKNPETGQYEYKKP